MKNFYVFIWLLPILCFGQIPPGYYNNLSGLIGQNLLIALHAKIDNHTVVPYSGLWAAFGKTDVKPNGKVWDIYGYVPSGPQNYEYTFVTMQCGSYAMESDCFNREHTWPQSWFNGFAGPDSDLFHIYPCDGFVNNKRNNYPFGTVATPSYLSLNGSKLGNCGDAGYSGIVFEPLNDIKGDMARSYFYMSTRYFSEDLSWANSPATNKSVILPWQLSVLLSWHHTDPVSAKEIARNDSIYYLFQNNRNPFIDHPEYADSIWFAYVGLNEELLDVKENYSVYPNPTDNAIVHVSGLHNANTIEVANTLGQVIYQSATETKVVDIDLSSFPVGVYILNIKTTYAKHSYKLFNSR
ncbi:MAG: endonuclease [Bacteroidota bacterium]|nr:endonuclease [Bacteroidota bacterium]